MADEVSCGQEVLRRQYPDVPLVLMYGDSVADWPREDLIRALDFVLGHGEQMAKQAAHEREILFKLRA